MRWLVLFVFGFLLGTLGAVALSQELPQMPQAVEWSEDELKLMADPGLFGGRPVKDGELKPSVYIGNCTATVVGPQVLLTAGHCRSTNSTATFTRGQTRYSGRCVRHPQYSQGGWLNNDFALCRFSPAIDLPVYGSLKRQDVAVGDKLIMQGYGAGSGGRLNVGDAVVGRINFMDIVTNGRVYLGSGDSGGGLFAYTSDMVNGPFVVVGVNSRGDRRNNSYFNRTALDRSQEFFVSYAKAQDVEVCGINWDCGADVPECREEYQTFLYAQSELDDAETALNECRAGN